MNENLRVKRLIYQSMHRGCKETDTLLGKFAQKQLNNLSSKELSLYESFISENDWDIYAWLVGTLPIPEKHRNGVVQSILEFDFINN